MTDYHAISNSGVVHVLTTHKDVADETPLQMISGQQLARLLAMESAVRALLALVGPGAPVMDNPGPACNPGCSTPPD